MAVSVVGRLKWDLDRDQEGHRTYTLVTRVITDDLSDGPESIYNGASGLPSIGDSWAQGNDSDVWARCTPYLRVTPVRQKTPCQVWDVENKFTTRPLNRCQDDSIEDPLLEPQKVSGSFVKYLKELSKDRHDKLILSSSHERVTGLSIDDNRPQVVIEQNVASLDLPTFSAMIDHLNDATLWGLGPRKIKLSDAPWERKLYGTCTYYYTRIFTFDIKFEGWDFSDVADAGFREFDTEIPNGDRDNPEHFKMIKDERGENVATRVMLDGNGSVNQDPVNNH